MKKKKVGLALLFFISIICCLQTENLSTINDGDLLDINHPENNEDIRKRENLITAADSMFNVTGVRIYNFYPLHLDNPLFLKTGNYKDAFIGENFATIFGFNESVRNNWMDQLQASSEIITDSVFYNESFNHVRFQFVSQAGIDFFMFPYLLISTEEICNSSTWIGSNELVSGRSSSILQSDALIRNYFGSRYTLSTDWLRPGDRELSSIISIEDIDPSIHELYELGGALPDFLFDDIIYSWGDPIGLLEEDPFINWDLGISVFPPFIAYRVFYEYHDLALVSHNDNHRMHGPYYYNQLFPGEGHSAITTSLIWHNDVILRYAENHVVHLLNDIENTFITIDEIIADIGEFPYVEIVQNSLEQLSIDVKSQLSNLQNQIFDLQDLIVHCDLTLSHFNSSRQFIPFEKTFRDAYQSIKRNLELASLRYSSLKSDFDSVLSIVSQIYSNQLSYISMNQSWYQFQEAYQLSQDALNQSWQQFQEAYQLSQDALDQSLLQFESSRLLASWGLIIAITGLAITISLKIHQDYKTNKSNAESNILRIAESLDRVTKKDQLKTILVQNTIDTQGSKRALAIRIVKKLGVKKSIEMVLEYS